MVTEITPPTNELGFDRHVAITDVDSGSCADVINGALSVTPLNALVPEEYDEIELGYTGDNVTTVTYKLASSTVATLTLTYTGDNLTNVTRT